MLLSKRQCIDKYHFLLIKDYKENDRQYRTQVKLKIIMALTTIVIAISAIVQIYLYYTD